MAVAVPASAATPRRYAPLNRPGPTLYVSRAALAAAYVCHGPFGRSDLEPVLLNPATGVTAEQNYSWNYERAFTAQGRPWCAVTMPHSTLEDIQTSGEYLVYAIRHVYAKAGRRIAVMGHSQGGMSMRWALRFWPDTRPMVDDVIGIAGSNHGTTTLGFCIVGVTNCTPAVWQQAADSRFIAALNSRAETFRGISYTEIYTHTDEVVQPNGRADRRPRPPCRPAPDGSRTSQRRTSARPTATSTCSSARSIRSRTRSRWTRSTTPGRSSPPHRPVRVP